MQEISEAWRDGQRRLRCATNARLRQRAGVHAI